MKEKIKEIEALRSISFVAVVTQHVVGYLGFLPNLLFADILFFSFILTLNRFAIPVFVFITGFVLFYNYYEKLNYQRFIYNRLKDTLIPYTSWVIIYNIWFHYINNTSTNDLLNFAKEVIFNILTGNGMYHLWYVVMILQMYLLFPVFRNLFIKFNKNNKAVFIVLLSGLFDILLLLMANYIIPLYLEHYPSNLMTDFFTIYRHKIFISWFFYLALGGFIAINYEKFKLLMKNVDNFKIYILTASIILATIFSFYDAKFSFEGYTVIYNATAPLTIQMFIYSVLLMVIVYNFTVSLDKKFKKISFFLRFLGQYSFGAYLIHPLYIFYICKIWVPKWSPNLYVQTITDIVLCCCLSLLTVYIINKIPLLNYLLVRPHKRKEIKILKKDNLLST